MKKALKKGIACTLGAAMIFSLTACGSSSDNGSEKGDGSKGEDIEIRLTSRWGGEETLSKYFNQKIEEFNELDNGITIVADNVTDEQQYFDKLSSANIFRQHILCWQIIIAENATNPFINFCSIYFLYQSYCFII